MTVAYSLAVMMEQLSRLEHVSRSVIAIKANVLHWEDVFVCLDGLELDVRNQAVPMSLAAAMKASVSLME